SVSNHQADVMTDKVYSLVAKTFDEFPNINRRRLLAVACWGTRRIAETVNIRRDDRIILAEFFKKRNPHSRSFAEPVNQNERRFSGSGFQIVNLHAVDFCRLRLITFPLRKCSNAEN